MKCMGITRVAKQGLTRPFGDERTVNQAFPSAIPTKDSDPFLMCDYFNMAAAEDGRHGDSLGNRETYATPGMQWMSTGSGVVHAEGGATSKGEVTQGFQIWVNVPSTQKMNDPRYGTVPKEHLPLLDVGTTGTGTGGATARVLAGTMFGVTGPFETTQPVQMIDVELQPNSQASLQVAEGLDTAMLYVYEGELGAGLNSRTEVVPTGSVVLLDASSDEQRGIEMRTGSSSGGGKAMLFAGKKLREAVAWHGPIVMNTQAQIQQALEELRSGSFPPVRVEWDYKRIASKPK